MTSAAGMLSSEGRCKTLDESADGYVRAEEIAVIGLCARGRRPQKTLAVIAGAAVNQDGRSSSLTAPNGPAQQAVIRSSLARGNIKAESIAALGMHGTGTPLGDPIEIGGMSAVLRPTSRGQGSRPDPEASAGSSSNAPLVLSASKARMGHGETAAGIVSVSMRGRVRQRSIRIAMYTCVPRSSAPY